MFYSILRHIYLALHKPIINDLGRCKRFWLENKIQELAETFLASKSVEFYTKRINELSDKRLQVYNNKGAYIIG